MSLAPEKKPAGYPPTPELDRRREVIPFSQKIGEFLDWLEQEKKWTLCEMHEHTDSCKHGRGLHSGDYTSVQYSTEKLLAEFFDIDLKKVQKEQDAVLDYLRDQHEQ